MIDALALHRQGRAADAQALTDGLDREALKEPRNALYYAVFLIATRRAAEAAEYSNLPGIRTLPPDEQALLGKAGIAAREKNWSAFLTLSEKVTTACCRGCSWSDE